MRSQPFRRIARVFATVLLLWTAADLLDHGLCAHDHLRIGAGGGVVLGATGEPGGSTFGVSDDCFCCSHAVEPGCAYRPAASAAEWDVSDSLPGRPRLTTVPLYHPPLT